MTRPDILRMAKEAVNQAGHAFDPELDAPEWLGNFAALVAAAEREACAKACDAIVDHAEESRSFKASNDAEKRGDTDEHLARMRHWMTVSTFNSGIKKCSKAIYARGANSFIS